MGIYGGRTGYLPENGVNMADTGYFNLFSFGDTCNLEPWRACELGMSVPEVCDGFDNDCDGEVDNACIVLGTLSVWKEIIEWFKDLF